jgi:ABC-type oligopeptide transport system substrate-binding subunit
MALSNRSDGDPFPPAWTENWFKELGVCTHLTYEPMEIQFNRIQRGDYDIVYATLTATVPDAADMMSGFRWPPEYTNTKWTDPELVRLLNQADTKTGAQRQAILAEAERLLMAAVPSVPVTFTRRKALMSATVQGWYEDPLGRQSFKRLWLDDTLPPLRANHSGI